MPRIAGGRTGVNAVRRGRCLASNRAKILALGVEMPQCLVLCESEAEGPQTPLLARITAKPRSTAARRGPVFGPDYPGYL